MRGDVLGAMSGKPDDSCACLKNRGTACVETVVNP